jgi:hypothetical protein
MPLIKTSAMLPRTAAGPRVSRAGASQMELTFTVFEFKPHRRTVLARDLRPPFSFF